MSQAHSFLLPEWARPKSHQNLGSCLNWLKTLLLPCLVLLSAWWDRLPWNPSGAGPSCKGQCGGDFVCSSNHARNRFHTFSSPSADSRALVHLLTSALSKRKGRNSVAWSEGLFYPPMHFPTPSCLLYSWIPPLTATVSQWCDSLLIKRKRLEGPVKPVSRLAKRCDFITREVDWVLPWKQLWSWFGSISVGGIERFVPQISNPVTCLAASKYTVNRSGQRWGC